MKNQSKSLSYWAVRAKLLEAVTCLSLGKDLILKDLPRLYVCLFVHLAVSKTTIMISLASEKNLWDAFFYSEKFLEFTQV